jgi:nucleoside 2-deoxyribosyltransferase
MKIYLASSWKNDELVRDWAKKLASVPHNHQVDAFCDPATGRYVFHFSEIGDPSNLDAMNFLGDERSRKAFEEDKKWIDWSDVVILILPAGKSSHLEAGYAKGRGKKLIIWQAYFPKGEFDVMYGFADLITESVADVLDFLAEAGR